MIKFHEVRFKNLLSFGNMVTAVKLDKSPSTLVQGRNGAGKSTVTDAICFGLFGKPFRKINKHHLPNHKNKKDTLVEVDFTVNDVKYTVRRGIAPLIFDIVQDGKLIDQSAAVKDYQLHLEQNILKFDFQTFTQLVILGKATYVSFMRLSAAERRRFIESILGLNVFSTMNDLHKQQVAELRTAKTEISNDVKIKREQITIRKKYIEDLESDAQKQLTAAKKRVDDQISMEREALKLLDDEMSALHDKMEDVDKEALESLQNRLQALTEIRGKLRMKQSQLQETMDFFAEHDVCPTCSQDISHEFKEGKTDELKGKSGLIVSSLDTLAADVESVADSMKAIQSSITRNQSTTIQLRELDKRIKEGARRIDALAKEVVVEDTDSRQKIDSEKEILATFEDTFEQLMDLRAQLMEKSEYYELISDMLKDSGIKAMVIKKYIPIINSTINHYLKQLGFFVKFTMDENFEEKIFARGIDELSYGNFSEGEKQRIDLAILLAWRDIAKLHNNMSTNLLLFDEILDGSLDSTGSENLVNLLGAGPGWQSTNIFVISHSPDRWADKFRSQIVFDKKNGFSCIL